MEDEIELLELNFRITKKSMWIDYTGYYYGYQNFVETSKSNYLNRSSYHFNKNDFTYGAVANILPLGIRSLYVSGNFLVGYVIGKKENKQKIDNRKLLEE